MTDDSERASEQDGLYPRPQLVRPRWASLDGSWDFAFDDDDAGLRGRWMQPGRPFEHTITVPFPPESEMSGIGDPGPHPVLWYRRRVTRHELDRAGHEASRILLLHFGAIDFRADVWIDGRHAATHEGGHTPFTVEVGQPGDGFDIVVRAWDDPHDLAQPRGKQDWEPQPHVIWYARTSGIWQTVWFESVPHRSIRGLVWNPDPEHARVVLALRVSRDVSAAVARVTVENGDEVMAEASTRVVGERTELVISLPALENGQDSARYLWSPENPRLVDALVELLDEGGRVLDSVRSYFGLRSFDVRHGRLLLNGRPHRISGVLSQGYWPGSHLAAPSPAALRAEVQLIRDLGFTTARIHQKVEDPRFLYWADRLGLMIWTEMPSAYVFTPDAARRLTAEWLEVLERDRSHPSIVAWVPFNESWGVDRMAVDESQAHLVRSLYHLTKAVDPTRIVISNDGWEHTESDLLTVHDYENDIEQLAARYSDDAGIAATVEGYGPSGRLTYVGTPSNPGRPVVLSEFGGVSVAEESSTGEWGYRVVATRGDLERQLEALFAAMHSSDLAGWCYTQLTDTAQETNGITDEHRVPKLPIERLRAIIGGGPRA